jgi:hypothetical protein
MASIKTGRCGRPPCRRTSCGRVYTERTIDTIKCGGYSQRDNTLCLSPAEQARRCERKFGWSVSLV